MDKVAHMKELLPFASLEEALEWLKKLDVQPPSRGTVAALAAAAFVWSALRAFRRVRVKSILKGLPGPSSPSWFLGALDAVFAERHNVLTVFWACAGNLPEMHDVLNFRWHHEATKKYGNVFQVNGMLGVSVLLFLERAEP